MIGSIRHILVPYYPKRSIPRTTPRLASALVPNQRRGILFAFAGILLPAFNVFDAADRGASGANVVAIACGAFLLFYGFVVVARSGRPPTSPPPSSPPSSS